MTDLSDALSASAAGMRAQASRIRHVSENISNADTPGYRRKMISFDQMVETGQVSPGRLSLDQSPLPQIFEPSHPLADDQGYYQGSNVDLILEIADAREAQRSYDANLRLFDQARQMAQSLFELLRR